MSSAAKDLICKLLEVDPCKRLTVKKAMEHPFLREAKTTASSYQSDLDNFLVKGQICLKPKTPGQIDQYLLGQLQALKS